MAVLTRSARARANADTVDGAGTSIGNTGITDSSVHGMAIGTGVPDSTSAVEPELPRASFLGIPVGLRLHIYSFIPDPMESQTWHSYKMDGLACGETESDDDTICIECCGPPGHNTWFNKDGQRRHDLAILAVSKQVFAEAMPVVYKAAEVGPYLQSTPRYAWPYVEKALVLCEYEYKFWSHIPDLPEYRYTDTSEWWAPLGPLWDLLHERYPRLRRLRFHVYVNEDSLPVPPQPFTAVEYISSLEEIIIGTRIRGQMSTKMKGLLDRSTAYIEHEAAQAERKILVTQSALDGETCLVCSKGSHFDQEALREELVRARAAQRNG